MRHTPEPNQSRGYGAKGHLLVALVFTLLAGGLWFYINRENIHEYMETYKNREAEIAEISELKQRISQLKRKQQSLTFNGVESEKQIRERLQMHKPGEKVIYIVDDADKITTETASIAAVTQSAAGSSASDAAAPSNRTKKDATKAPAPQKITSVYDAM